jgi:hypothetical protein
MESAKVRRAVFAGSWYPSSAAECEKEINGFLAEGKKMDIAAGEHVGGIVPHAGWFYSGSIACNVISSLKSEEPPDVIVVFGMHLHPDSPCIMMAEGAWETPFGEIRVDERLTGELARQFPFTLESSSSFTQDNTIELQLPFIKYFFKDARIVAMGVPPAILTPALTASSILSRWIWPGMISLWAWAMPIKGLLISSLVYPMAFIRERWGALSIPFFMRSLRIIGFLFCSYYIKFFILLSKCTNKCLLVPAQLCSMRRNMVWKNFNFQRWLVSVEESTQSSVGCQEK